ncbi:hypothetical protein [Pasteurella testudinis]|uniref:hypothetical protein n=1 Tax=Pasteurella testudinis TaxID=761 RepID=UPI00405868F1
MQNRANHIYLLLIALLNIGYGQYVPIRRWQQKAAAVLLFAAGVCASFGFFVESTAAIEARMLMPGAVGLVFAAACLLIGKHRANETV